MMSTAFQDTDCLNRSPTIPVRFTRTSSLVLFHHSFKASKP